jgi:hypothetical protein
MQADAPSVTIVVAGRNDDYGGDFRGRLFRTARHNISMLEQARLAWEYLLVEWNPLPDRPLLSEEFVKRVPCARALVVAPRIHDTYSLQRSMPFHEMPAKNAGLRRARSPWVIVTNADVLFGPDVLAGLAVGDLDPARLYRARRADVSPESSWYEMQSPQHHLLSGEGESAPVDYLGAGGDFCLASRALWHELRGFDEQIRFSTRAKDWQFFLSARERGIPIEFVGTVFHLDHDGGFRNTAAGERLSAGIHFGGPWDIEFGLPTLNSPAWGLGTLGSDSNSTENIEILQPAECLAEGTEIGPDLRDWLAGSEPDWLTAAWLHTLYGASCARRPLWVNLRSPRAAARLQGFLPLAQSLDIEVRGRWQWPVLDGFTLLPLSSGPLGGPSRGDWIVSENDPVSLENPNPLSIAIDGLPKALWPRRRVPHAPPFNPLLARRLLRAWVELETAGARRILIHGAGSHTRDLLAFGWPDSQELTGIVVSQGPETRLGDLPVRPVDGIDVANIDALVLSSVSYEGDMRLVAEKAGFRRIVSLYESWPRSLAKARKAEGRAGSGASQ